MAFTIPVKQSTAQLPGSTSPTQFSAEYMGAGVGRAIGGLADVAERFELANDANATNEAVSQYTKDINEYTNKLTQDVDAHDAWEGNLSRYTEAQGAAFKSKLSPRAAREFDKSYKQMNLQATLKVRDARRGVIQVKGKAGLASAMEIHANEYALAKTDAERFMAREKVASAIELQRGVGNIDDLEAVKYQESWSKSAIETRVRNDLMENPYQAKENIETNVYGLPEDQRAIWAGHAEQFVKSADAEKDRLEKEEKQAQKEALKLEKEKTGNEMFSRFISGELTLLDIERSSLDPTGENSKMSWATALKTKANDEKEKPTKTNPEINAQVFSDIMGEPVIDDQKILEIEQKLVGYVSSKEMTTDDAKAYAKLARDRKIEDPLKTERAKTSIKRLDDAKRDKILDSEQWAFCVDALKRYIANHPEEDPADFIDNLLKPAEKDWGAKFVDLIFSGAPGTDKIKEEKRKVVIEEAGKEIPRKGIRKPSYDSWAETMKKKYPSKTDQELKDGYIKAYGE